MTFSAASRIRWNGSKFRFDPSKPRWIEIAKLLARVAGLFSDITLTLVSTVSIRRCSRAEASPLLQAHIGSIGPEAMSDHVGARVWPCSRDVYEVTIPRDVLDCLERQSSRNGTFRAGSSIPCAIMAGRG